MISYINILLLLLFFMITPYILGMFWTGNLEAYRNSAAMSVISGTITMLAVFELVAVPMILTKQPFHMLVNVWSVLIGGLMIVSLVINFKQIPDMLREHVSICCKMRATEILIWLATLLLIVVQIYMPVGHMRTDTDDARFVAEAMESYELDTMLQYHPITGEYVGEPIGEMRKDIASPFPIFMALTGSLLQLTPPVAVHVFFPIIFILLAYAVYYLLGNYFTHGNGKYTALFLFFISLLHCFAYESIYAAGYTLLAVIWQGRSVLAMVIMPFIWLLLMKSMDQNNERTKYFALLLCAVLAGLLTSSMAIELLPILIGTYSVMIGIKSRTLRPAVKMAFLIIPCVACYCIYR